ncbi:hypothetical protein Lal_00028767 [Lupinus albus]|uniref:Uncharacterized protein n=1 Tax=Lupinus albus TaxID=3870 RepID=A0A6A4NUZ3_LUPAL|nr:hypothetical protein Lalb_Chr19g0134211 [Lupinus albus]KAF1884879.1 hypothetical protein Lal_00028767 [Lupinus albus]
MASAIMLKIKPNSKLPLQFLCSPMSSLIRPVVPIPHFTNQASQKNSIFPVMGMTQNLFTGLSGVSNGGFRLAGCAVSIRQMGTSRSTRGSSSKNEDFDDDDVEDFDDVDEDEDTVDFDDEDMDSFDEDEVDNEGFEDDEEEEEEKPKWKKKRF